ncbi:MAG: SIS domain-containing protein [Polyangiales bacterium]
MKGGGGDPKSARPDFTAFAEAYRQQFLAAVASWDLAALAPVAAVLADARARGATVLLAGNGGSAAIVNHTECDASKGTSLDGAPTLNTRSLAANTSVITALGNDFGYETIFAKQVGYYGKAGDVLLLVSASGNSPNVVAACRAARAQGITTVAFVGFDGGALRGLADHVLHVPVHNCGMVEDLHQASMHLLTQFLRLAWTHDHEAATGG